jgi:GNAT superfamily N-acetyltransferase
VVQRASAPGILEALDAQGVETTELWTTWRGGRIHRDSDMMRFVSGEPVFFANGVVGARLRSEEADRRIEETTAFFEREGVPWGWWVSPLTAPPDIEERLQGRGFHIQEEIPRYAAEIDRVAAGTGPPDGLVTLRVADEADQAEWLDVMARGFVQDEARTLALGRAAASAGLDPADPWVRFLGRLHGRPVGSSGLILAAGLAGIINVATVPDARGRGVGTAMTFAAVREARARGYRVAVLGASDMAVTLYERLGFHRVGWTRGYVR